MVFLFKGVSGAQTLDTERDTIRTIFDKFKTATGLPNNTPINNFVFKLVSLTTPRVVAPEIYNWDTPIQKVILDFNLQKETTFNFEYHQSETNMFIERDLPLVRSVLNFYRQTGAKILPESFNQESDTYRKNVAQQFKFNRKPISPIILIDPAFEDEKSYRKKSIYQFYDYLNFKKTPTTNSKVIIYTKEAGKPLSIKPTFNIPEENKKKYLEEVLLQAKASGVDIEKEEIQICCVSAWVDITNNRNWTNYRMPLADNYRNSSNKPIFHVYSFSEGESELNNKIKNLQGNKRNSSVEEMPPLEPITPPKGEQRSTMENLD